MLSMLLAEQTLILFRAAGKTIGTVESCTGGLIAAALTEIPGSSDVVMGGFVTYANQLKTALADVPESLIAEHGAVSEAVVRAMAEGGRRKLGVDVAVAVSGVAGPGGGTAEKPVGLVHFAAASASVTLHRRMVFPGDRSDVRHAAVEAALLLVQEALRA